MIDAAVFDLDGTLVDSQRIAAEAFREAHLICVGEGAPVAAFHALSGRPLETILEELGLPPSMASHFRRLSRERIDRLALFPGMLDILALLEHSRVSLGVITGKDRGRTLEVLEHLGVEDRFQAVVTASDPPAAKPSPEGVVSACARMGVAVERSVVIGDSVTDVAAGNAAGAHTIACLWGVGREPDLVSARPTWVARNPRLLRARLQEIAPAGARTTSGRLA